MLPTLAPALPGGAGWLFEIKWDGVRVLAIRAGGRVRLYSRNQADVSGRYPEVTAALARLPGADLVLDGELVVLEPDGRASFARLQRRMHLERGIAVAAAATPVTAYFYDCLMHDGGDRRDLPLRARKALLRELLPPGDAVLRYSDHVEDDGQRFLAAARTMGIEGVVAKRADGPYRAGRRPEWLKVKCHRRQEFVIGGWTDPKGTRGHLGAVHLGVHEGGLLVYVGRAGAGLGGPGLPELHRRLGALAAERPPFARGPVPRGREHHWVRPALVCEVRFTEWTPDGCVRHPVFLGLRDDKPPEAVVREAPTPRA